MLILNGGKMVKKLATKVNVSRSFDKTFLCLALLVVNFISVKFS